MVLVCGRDPIFRPSDYCYCLSDETVAELDSAVRRIRSSGRSIFTLTAQDFPLPSFENDAEALRQELRFGSGFVLVKGLASDRYSEEESA